MKEYKRHGDVILHPVEKIAGKQVKHNGNLVLAFGEATGHSHQMLCEPKMEVLNNSGRIMLNAESGAELVHQQHKPLKLKEKYAQVQEREIDHFSGAVRKVVD